MASTRESIMDVATDLFIEQGYERTSLREIAEGVGVTKAALYYHFASKEDLIRALLEPMSEMELDLLARVPERPTVTEWADFMDEFISWMAANLRLFHLLERNHELFDSLHEEGHSHLQLHQRIDELLADKSRDLEERIRMASSMGVAFAFAGFGSGLYDESTPEFAAKVMSDTMRRALGL